jgi:hypothetical protein
VRAERLPAGVAEPRRWGVLASTRVALHPRRVRSLSTAAQRRSRCRWTPPPQPGEMCSGVRHEDERMSVGGRARERGRILRRASLVAGALVLLTLLLLVTGHWVLAIIAGLPAAVAVWVFLQARTVR